MKTGWRTQTFGELGRVFNGNSISETVKKAHFAGLAEGLPYIGTKDVSFDRKINYESGVRIPDGRRNGFKLAPANTILVCAEGGSAGRKIAFTDRAVCFGNKLFAICPNSPNSSRFLFFYCLSDAFATQFNGAMAGLIGGVSLNKFKDLRVDVPNGIEQQRIVDLLDEAFERIAIAKTNTEKNLQNVRDIFESYIETVFTQRGDGWVGTRLSDCVESISTGPFGSLLHKSDYVRGGIPLVNPVNIEGVEIVPDERKAVGNATAQRLARYMLHEHDVVIGRRGDIGRCAVVGRSQAGWLCGTGCFVIRPSERTDPYFLTHLLRSRPYREKLEGVAARATMPSISNIDLANLVIALPPIQQQRRIVAQIAELSSETNNLASVYERKIAMLEALERSLLNQAFMGNL